VKHSTFDKCFRMGLSLHVYVRCCTRQTAIETVALLQ
jgi:hypothetical protein